MALIKEMCLRKEMESIRWIETKDQLVYPLTKQEARSEKLQNFLRKGELHIDGLMSRKNQFSVHSGFKTNTSKDFTKIVLFCSKKMILHININDCQNHWVRRR